MFGDGTLYHQGRHSRLMCHVPRFRCRTVVCHNSPEPLKRPSYSLRLKHHFTHPTTLYHCGYRISVTFSSLAVAALGSFVGAGGYRLRRARAEQPGRERLRLCGGNHDERQKKDERTMTSGDMVGKPIGLTVNVHPMRAITSELVIYIKSNVRVMV
ncbi:hypothetical protein H4582DRAFT_1481601 [Lactarius indigo]|nr:hypothetical protein H4582DRAFT_1481601 [Lactarius indigo]